MQQLISIFNILAKYDKHESVYFTGPLPQEIKPEDLQLILELGAEWDESQSMWKKTVTLPDIVVSQIEEQSEFLRSSFIELKSKL